MITNLGFNCAICSPHGSAPCAPTCFNRQRRERDALERAGKWMDEQPRCAADHMAIRNPDGSTSCHWCELEARGGV